MENEVPSNPKHVQGYVACSSLEEPSLVCDTQICFLRQKANSLSLLQIHVLWGLTVLRREVGSHRLVPIRRPNKNRVASILWLFFVVHSTVYFCVLTL